MKNFFTFLAFILFFATVVKAQDLTSKKGVPILPEKGEWAIGIDAVPFFYYVGNIFNANASNGSPSFDFTGNYPMTMYGKYMVDAKKAYRFKLQITYNSQTNKEFVTKDAVTTDPDVTVEDKAKRNNMDVVLGAGLEKRRGKGRVQGVYGAEALIKFGSGKNTFDYGNSWNPNLMHHTANFGDNYYGGTSDQPITEKKVGSTFGFGVRGFAGVEYFFAPKISIGGEFGWGISFTSTGEGNTTYEYLDNTTATPYINTKEVKNGGGSTFGFHTDNLSGAINLLFYF